MKRWYWADTSVMNIASWILWETDSGMETSIHCVCGWLGSALGINTLKWRGRKWHWAEGKAKPDAVPMRASGSQSQPPGDSLAEMSFQSCLELGQEGRHWCLCDNYMWAALLRKQDLGESALFVRGNSQRRTTAEGWLLTTLSAVGENALHFWRGISAV